MKKLLALLLAIVMASLMVACFPNDDEKATDANKTVEESETNAPESTPNITRGTFEGDIYTNSSLGFKFTKPASWVFSTDEEIAAMVNLGAEKIYGENFEQTLKTSSAVYDMMVVDSLTGTNFNVGYENLALSLASKSV